MPRFTYTDPLGHIETKIVQYKQEPTLNSLFYLTGQKNSIFDALDSNADVQSSLTEDKMLEQFLMLEDSAEKVIENTSHEMTPQPESEPVQMPTDSQAPQPVTAKIPEQDQLLADIRKAKKNVNDGIYNKKLIDTLTKAAGLYAYPTERWNSIPETIKEALQSKNATLPQNRPEEETRQERNALFSQANRDIKKSIEQLSEFHIFILSYLTRTLSKSEQQFKNDLDASKNTENPIKLFELLDKYFAHVSQENDREEIRKNLRERLLTEFAEKIKYPDITNLRNAFTAELRWKEDGTAKEKNKIASERTRIKNKCFDHLQTFQIYFWTAQLLMQRHESSDYTALNDQDLDMLAKIMIFEKVHEKNNESKPSAGDSDSTYTIHAKKPARSNEQSNSEIVQETVLHGYGLRKRKAREEEEIDVETITADRESNKPMTMLY
jgi:hypothetical protein